MTLEVIKYKIKGGRIIIRNTQNHDKILKYLFSKEEVAIKFINDILEIKGKEDELKKGQLERCNSEFINKTLGKLQSDIVYRKKGTLIYYAIEHQSTVDYEMPLRMFKYSAAIMEEAEKQYGKANGKEKFAGVYPIVLYTGRGKWNAERYITKLQQKMKSKNLTWEFSYFLKDVNNYTKEELLKEKGALAKVLLLEKARNEKDVSEIITKILKQKLDEEEKDIIAYALRSFLRDSIGEEEAKEIIEKLKEGGEDGMVVENLERIYRNVEKRGERRGKLEGEKIGEQRGRKDIAKRMLKMGMSEEDIQKITQLGRNIIEKLKIQK